MPDAHETVTLGAHDHRRLLAAGRPPVQAGEVVGGELQRVEEIVEILDVADRPQPAHGRADGLPKDGGLADAGVGQPKIAVFRLQSLEHEVDIAQPPNILADYEKTRVTREVGVEVAQQDLAAVRGRRRIRVNRRDYRHFEWRFV